MRGGLAWRDLHVGLGIGGIGEGWRVDFSFASDGVLILFHLLLAPLLKLRCSDLIIVEVNI